MSAENGEVCDTRPGRADFPLQPAEICTDVEIGEEVEMTQIGLVKLIPDLFTSLTSPFLYAGTQTFAPSLRFQQTKHAKYSNEYIKAHFGFNSIR